jgi:D-sedoheptulose 7-phosphate isomerase
MDTFTNIFLNDTLDVVSKIKSSDVEQVIEVIANVREGGGRLFIAGSGGGAGHASHATCDFRKLCNLEAYCVTDNVSELTARTNDEGWDTAYSNWLQSSRLNEKDCLLVFSVGGGSIEPPVSVNLINAIQLAKRVGAKVVGIVGRNGGVLRELATASVLIPTVDSKFVTPQAEGLQALIWHLIVSHPLLARSVAKWEVLANRTSN